MRARDTLSGIAAFLPRSGLCILWAALFGGLLRAEDLRSQEFMTEAREGFARIYNLDYREASETFLRLKRRYPGHPAPPLYLATVIWLQELFERNELDLDNFIAPAYFTEPTASKMGAEQRRAFTDYLLECARLSQDILRKNPRDQDARYFMGSMHGITGAFSITIDRSYRDAFSAGKKAYQYHHDLVNEKPTYYDAYMSVGLYEYVVDNLPWYVKWIATIVGYRGSEARGFEYLNRTAEKGDYSADDARVLQMVLFVRERRFEEALKNATILHGKHPRNFILHVNRAQILEKMGKKEEMAREYAEILRRAETGIANYQKIPLDRFRLSVARKMLGTSQFDASLEQFNKLLAKPSLGEGELVLSHLGAGQALDALGRRAEALRHYNLVLASKDYGGAHAQARRHLSRAYRGAE